MKDDIFKSSVILKTLTIAFYNLIIIIDSWIVSLSPNKNHILISKAIHQQSAGNDFEACGANAWDIQPLLHVSTSSKISFVVAVMPWRVISITPIGNPKIKAQGHRTLIPMIKHWLIVFLNFHSPTHLIRFP